MDGLGPPWRATGLEGFPGFSAQGMPPSAGSKALSMGGPSGEGMCSKSPALRRRISVTQSVASHSGVSSDPLTGLPGLLDCTHCGLCLDACPTYKISGAEADSPRGRLALLRAVEEGRIESREAAPALERCLLCRACEPACPSQVPYHDAWSRWQNQQGVTTGRSLLSTIASPWKLRVFGILLRLARATGMLGFLEKWGPSGLSRKAGSVPKRAARWRPSSARFPAEGEPRGRVGLHPGCVNAEFFGPTLRNLTRLLTRQGFEVVVPAQPTCCGALHGHAGAGETGNGLAHSTLEAFDPELDAILSPSAGCTGWLKELGGVRVKDPVVFLHEVELRGEPTPLFEKVLYDPPCHLKNVLGGEAAAPELFAGIPGIEIVHHDEADLCCGAGGIAFLRGEASADAVLERKIEAMTRAGDADSVVSGNPGCLMRLEAGLHGNASTLRVEHPIDLLARAWAPN